MDAASILLVLAAAGQAGWAPERSSSSSPVAARDYDRYAQPPVTSASGFGPPPSVVDRTRTAITESGTTLREGFEAGVRAANEQLQGWADSAAQQLQPTGNSLRSPAGSSSAPQVSNPFSPAVSAPTTTGATVRGGVAPPPWTELSGATDSNWDTNAAESGPSFGGATSPGSSPTRSENGWTSIGSQVAAPPLLVPPLTSATAAAPLRTAPVSDGFRSTSPASDGATTHSASGDSSRQNARPASGADSWATGWGDNSSAPQATISRSAANISLEGAAREGESVPVRTVDSHPPAAQPRANGNWADLWGDNDSWANTPQAPPTSKPAQEAAATASAAPPANSQASQPIMVPPANSTGTSVAATGVLQTSTGLPEARGAASQALPTEQPPWLPLLIVSLSLAGSLGANLFLGWSYLDARQKYRGLVRKTADKFRRAAAA